MGILRILNKTQCTRLLQGRRMEKNMSSLGAEGLDYTTLHISPVVIWGLFWEFGVLVF